MTKSGNPKVDFYFSKANLPAGKAEKWQEELEQLRMIVLDCGLTEELKWGVPCYTRPTGSSGRALEVNVNTTLFIGMTALFSFILVKYKMNRGLFQSESLQVGFSCRADSYKIPAQQQAVNVSGKAIKFSFIQTQ